MSVELLDLNLIQQRLQVNVVKSTGALKLVEQVVQIQPDNSLLKSVYPVAYVLPSADVAGANNLLNAVSQEITATFAVFIAVRALKHEGASVRQGLQEVREEVMGALLGWTLGEYDEPTGVWTPDGRYTPIEYVRGRAVSMTDMVMWWADEYRTRFEVRKT